MLFEYYSPYEGIDAIVALLIAMLRDEERYATLPDTTGVLLHHVVAHNLDVAAISVEQEVTHDVRLRIERDAMVRVGMRVKVFLEQDVVLTLGALVRQVKDIDLYLGEMVVHIVPEPYLTVVLLLAGYIDTVEGLLHEHDLFLLAGQEHEHLCSEIA